MGKIELVMAEKSVVRFVAFLSVAALPWQLNAGTLISVDIGGGDHTDEVGPAAIGHGANDFWNYYTRNGANNDWLTFGSLASLKTVEGVTTSVGFTIANAPGAWGNGSSDSMYESYDYPFDGGNVTVVFTNLDAGAYDFYVYGFDSSYEISVNEHSFGVKPLPNGPFSNPVVWQENQQYARFAAVPVNTGESVTLTVRPGPAGGYATLAGMQIESVARVNHPPVANSQSLSVAQGGSRVITLTGSDLDGDALTYTVTSQPTHGSLAVSGANCTYTPDSSYWGNDSFKFRVNDGGADSDEATVSILVTATGTMALIDVDFGAGTSTTETGPAATGHISSDFWNFYTRDDAHGNWLTFGSLSYLKTAEGSPTAAGLTVANAPGAWGNGSADAMYESYIYPFNGGNIIVTVSNLDAGSYDFYFYGLDSRYELVVGNLSYGVKSLPNGPYNNPVVWQEGLQYVRFESVHIATGDSLILTVRPGQGGYATISGMQIAGVVAGNHTPIANSQSVVVNQDGSKDITLTASDLDGDTLQFSIVQAPAHGRLEGSAPNVTYVPDAAYYGSDSFNFKANDGHVDSAPATVNITVYTAGTGLLNIDFVGGDTTSEVGPAAIGHGPADFWNAYSRNDGQGGWRTFGALTSLKTAEGNVTGSGLTVANAPGAWGNGSADPMYDGYIYPFDGGNVTVTLTNLTAGQYDFLVYGIDSYYQLQVDGTNYGTKALLTSSVVNPVVWQEGVQYVLFTNVSVPDATQPVVLTISPGNNGYATISGMQIAGHAPATGPTNSPPLAVPAVAPPVATTRPAAAITSAHATLNAAVNPKGAPTTAWFEWGTTPTYGNTTPPQMLGESSADVPFSIDLNGLTSNHTYYFRVHATNLLGASLGTGVSFTWSSSRPQLTTRSASPGQPFKLHFAAAAGQTYQVQQSSDLLHWSALGTAVESSSGNFEFSDPDSANQPRRFYRLIVP
jgi:hypothetical protein